MNENIDDKNIIENKDIKFAYFGTPDISVQVLDILKKYQLIPRLVVTSPDKPRGRKMRILPPPVKTWAEKNDVEVLQPENIDKDFIQRLRELSPESGWDVFVVVAYGHILPKEIFEIPEKGSINLHYSLLPRLRGPSPVEGALLGDINPTGVSVILMDEKMDHGPILAQESVEFDVWPIPKSDVIEALNEVGGRALSKTINNWLAGNLEEQEQNHKKATYTKIIKKEDGLIDLSEDPEKNLRKIYAYQGWPKAYFMEEEKRVVIDDAKIEDGRLEILRVTPEGKKKMAFREYKRTPETLK